MAPSITRVVQVGLQQYPFAQINDNVAKKDRTKQQGKGSHAAEQQDKSPEQAAEQKELEQLNECSSTCDQNGRPVPQHTAHPAGYGQA